MTVFATGPFDPRRLSTAIRAGTRWQNDRCGGVRLRRFPRRPAAHVRSDVRDAVSDVIPGLSGSRLVEL